MPAICNGLIIGSQSVAAQEEAVPGNAILDPETHEPITDPATHGAITEPED